jgi:hypothetical protein
MGKQDKQQKQEEQQQEQLQPPQTQERQPGIEAEMTPRPRSEDRRGQRHRTSGCDPLCKRGRRRCHCVPE